MRFMPSALGVVFVLLTLFICSNARTDWASEVTDRSPGTNSNHPRVYADGKVIPSSSILLAKSKYPIRNAATLERWYANEAFLAWLHIPTQATSSEVALFSNVYDPQITSDPSRQRVYCLGEVGVPNPYLMILPDGSYEADSVVLNTPFGCRGLVWDPITDALYTLLMTTPTDSAILWTEIDPATGALDVLGTIEFLPPGAPSLSLIAVASNGLFYGISDVVGAESLWSLDRTTLIATHVGYLDGVLSPDDMAFVGNELWIERGDGQFERISLSNGATLESYDIGATEGVAQRPCGGSGTSLTARDAPFDSGGYLVVDWSSYSPPAGTVQYEVFLHADPCQLDDPLLTPSMTVPVGTSVALIPSAADYTAFYVSVRAVGTLKLVIIDTQYAGPVWTAPNLVINEFAPAGGIPKVARAHKVGEKVEIRNLSPNPLDLTGFRLSNGTGAPSPDVELLSGSVPGDGLFVHTLQSIDLPDTGGTLLLLPPAGFSVPLDIVAYGTQGGAPTVPAGFTVSRVEGTTDEDPDRSSFEAGSESFGFTNNVPEPDLGGSVVINETLYTSSSGEDYVEIQNPQSTLINMGEIAISDGVGFFEILSEGLVLGPGERTVLRQSDLDFPLPDLTSPMLYLYKVLSTGQYQRIDQLGWQGGPTPPPPPGDALMRIPDGSVQYLGDAGTNWQDCGGGDALLYGVRSPGDPNVPPGASVELVDPLGGPGTYPTINAALAALSPPVTILVAPGEYAEAITLESGFELIGAGQDPQAVVITGGGVTPVVELISGPSPEVAVLASLTIRASGVAVKGSGVAIRSGNPILRNVRFEENQASVYGGALSCEGGSPLLLGCLFLENSAGDRGGAIIVESGQMVLRDCLFVMNRADTMGGALFVSGGDVTLEHNVFDRNQVFDPMAGIIHVDAGTAGFSHSIVSNNMSGKHISASGTNPSTYVDFRCGVLAGLVLDIDTSAGVIDTSNVYRGDPGFCQPLALNYSLQENSPLIHEMESCGELIGLTGPPCALVTDAGPSSTPLHQTRLWPPVPNPFNPRTLIRVELARSGSVDLSVYDARGRRIRSLLSAAEMDTGIHSVIWKGQDATGRSVASGVYFLQMLVDGQPTGMTRRVVLLR